MLLSTNGWHLTGRGRWWLSRADRNGNLAAFLKPDLTPPERSHAQVQG